MTIRSTLAACVLCAAAATAQRGEPPVLAGTFEISVGPRAIATETITTKTLADGRRQVRSAIEMGGRTRIAVTTLDGVEPVDFAWGEGPDARRWPIGDHDAFAANNVWHHYVLIAAFSEPTEKGRRIALLVPGVKLSRKGSIRYAPLRLVEHEGKVLRIGHVVLGLEAFTIDIFFDEAGRTIAMAIPSQNAHAVRTDAKALYWKIRFAPTEAEIESCRTERVALDNDGLSLVGTLSLPREGKGPFPCAVTISGSGVQDRDGNPGGANLFRRLATALGERGIACLRVDDRAAGESAVPTGPTSYRDLIADTAAAVAFARGHDAIDPKRIVLIGHSEGAQTAGILAAEDPAIAAIVLMAGTSKPLDAIVLEQGRYQQSLAKAWTPKTKPMRVIRQLLAMFETARGGAKDEKISDLNDYLREHAASDPSKTVASLKCPILIVQGERDRKVLAYHAFALANAAIGGGNERVTVRVFSNLSHDFTPFPDPTTELDPEALATVDSSVLATVQRWLVKGMRK